MDTAILLFRQYSGQGMVVTLFLISILYLWFVEKDKANRSLFVIFPICVLAMFFCPLVVWVMEKLSEEDVYWRMLWSLPMVMVIAYATVVLVRKTESIKRYMTIGGVVVFIVISGDYLYNNPNHLKAENLNHIPQDIIDICDEIIVDGREVKAAFPRECLTYVTQYTALVHMPYGREMFLISDGAMTWNRLYEIMESSVVDTNSLANELRNDNCHYVVLRKNTILDGNLEKEDWIVYCETEQYTVYLDKNNDPHYW